MKLIDLTGQRFGSLVVIERDYSDKKNAKWFCQCDCGKIVSKSGQGLRNGESTCCDRRTCPNKKELFENLRGQTFGRLTAIEPTNKRINNSVVWKCICNCGTEKMVPASLLKSGGTKSCGCLKKETSINECKKRKTSSFQNIKPIDFHVTETQSAFLRYLYSKKLIICT